MIEACALQPDIDSLPAGDSSEIGEKVGEVYIYLILCSFIVRDIDAFVDGDRFVNGDSLSGEEEIRC